VSKPSDYHPWVTFIYAREEARRRGDRRVGTEHLVLGLVSEPAMAEVLGRDLPTARAALDALDHDALVAVGLGEGLDAPPIPGENAEADGAGRVEGQAADDSGGDGGNEESEPRYPARSPDSARARDAGAGRARAA